MKFPSFVRAMVCALALLLSAGAFAQGMGGGSITGTPKDKSTKEKSSKSGKSENKYPNATRKEPKLDMASGDQKDLNKLIMDKIQSVEGVGRTETHIAVE